MNAVIGAGMDAAVLRIILHVCAQYGLIAFGVRADRAFGKRHNAVAYFIFVAFLRISRQAVFCKRTVHGGGNIRQGINQRTVQIENHAFFHTQASFETALIITQEWRMRKAGKLATEG